VFAPPLLGGGGATPSVTRNEVVRVAWSFRRRVELVGDLEADAAASPQDVLLRRRLEKVHKYIARNASYRAVLSHSGQFSGFGDARYRIAKDPAKLVTNAEVCGRLTLTREVALGVMDGSITDPYAGAGNPTAPGCLYYMTKEAWAKFTKWNQEHPGEPPKFAPTWDRLPAQNGDKHYYWGMKAEDPFLPP
jgi:hypothetical protein